MRRGIKQSGIAAFFKRSSLRFFVVRKKQGFFVCYFAVLPCDKITVKE